jgi:hypothetical protein
MDVVFGSDSVAQADMERMEAINREIGLDVILRGSSNGSLAEQAKKVNTVEENGAAAEPQPEHLAEKLA